MSRFAERLFRVPPFPGAKPFEIVREAVGTTQQVDAETFAKAIRRERIGGAFWDKDDPWRQLAAGKTRNFETDDPLALLAAIAGCAVICTGTFSPLSGLASDTPEHDAVLHDLIDRHLLSDIEWCSPFTGEPTSPLEIIRIMGEWRRLIEDNRAIGAAFGFAAWKQDTVAALLWPGDRPTPFAAPRLDRLPPHAGVAVWKARVPADFLETLKRSDHPVWEVEDGFIRSIGLGADCVPPLSIVVDDLGAHYDPSRPNRLEQLLSRSEGDSEKLARARALRDAITTSGISKYGVGGSALPRPAGERRHVLVVGQVEDDRSVLLGGCGLASNHELLRRVRERCPDAFILYRPHPDVEAGHRKGHVPVADAMKLADRIDADSAITDLIAMVDEVHVLTSLAGFEALLRCKTVVTHGVPFYAGWGLTTDLGPVPGRRGHPLDLDQLVAAVLIDYPRYLDPVTGLPTDVELVIHRMGAGVRRENGALVKLRKGWGRLNRHIGRLWARVRA